MANLNSTEVAVDDFHQVSLLESWSQKTGWHGIIHMRNATSVFAKIFWLLLILSSCFCAINQSIALIWDFNSNCTWVISMTTDKVTDDGLEWPNISVCYSDPSNSWLVKKSGLHPYDVAFTASQQEKTIAFYDQYQADVPLSRNQSELRSVYQKYKEKHIRRLLEHPNTSFTEVYQHLMRDCNSTVVHCGKSIEFDLHVERDCCVNSYVTTFGECFQINPTKTPGKSYEAAKSSVADSAVYYLFNPRIDETYSKILLGEKSSAGLRLELYYGLRHQGTPFTFFVAPGKHALVSLSPTKFRTVTRKINAVQLAKSTSKLTCKDSHDYVYLDFSPNVYSKRLCEIDCDVRLSMAFCNCSIFSVPLKKGDQCVGESIVFCTDQWRRVKALWNHTYPNGYSRGSCVKSCLEACEHKGIDATLSTALFPATPKVKSFNFYLNRAFATKNISYTEAQVKQLILCEMDYATKEYSVVERVTRVSSLELISNIGGVFGVFTGISLLCVFQCFTYIAKGLLSLCMRHLFYSNRLYVVEGKK